MLVKKMLEKYPSDHRRIFGFGMISLLIGILLQRIGSYISSQSFSNAGPYPFIQGLLLGMGTIFVLFSIYLNSRSLIIYGRSRDGQWAGKEKR